MWNMILCNARWLKQYRFVSWIFMLISNLKRFYVTRTRANFCSVISCPCRTYCFDGCPEYFAKWGTLVMPQDQLSIFLRFYQYWNNVTVKNLIHIHPKTPCFALELICPIQWSQVLSRERRCGWSSADRRCSTNYIWVISKFMAY